MSLSQIKITKKFKMPYWRVLSNSPNGETFLQVTEIMQYLFHTVRWENDEIIELLLYISLITISLWLICRQLWLLPTNWINFLFSSFTIAPHYMYMATRKDEEIRVNWRGNKLNNSFCNKTKWFAHLICPLQIENSTQK